MIDDLQFETALFNLVANANDAMPEGGGLTIASDDVSLRDPEIATLSVGQYMNVLVQDDGTGITPEAASRAIDPFFSAKQVGKGTGLGLSQEYGPVKQSGGYLDIASTQTDSRDCHTARIRISGPYDRQ